MTGLAAVQAMSGSPHDLALVIADLGAGGAQRVAITLAEGLSRQGTRVSVITWSGDGTDHFRVPAGVTRIALSLQSPSRGALPAAMANFRRLRALRQAVRASGAPVVLAMAGITNILTVLACHSLPVRVVISERNDPLRQRLGRPWDWLRRRLYSRADIVTANSRCALDAMAAYVPRSKLVWVPNPVTAPKRETSSDVPPVLLSIGRLARQKGFDVLLAAFARAVQRAPGWRLRIVGHGSEGSALRTQAAALGAAVEFLPPVPDVWPLYAGASAFVLASRHEGTPNVALEAMASGLPVVVSDGCGGATDYVSDGESGLIVPAENAESLAAALERIMTDPRLRHRLGQAARARMAEETPERALLRWRDVLGLPALDAT